MICGNNYDCYWDSNVCPIQSERINIDSQGQIQFSLKFPSNMCHETHEAPNTTSQTKTLVDDIDLFDDYISIIILVL